jgi:glycosyltransferase involved in cell wall biosynthesis
VSSPTITYACEADTSGYATVAARYLAAARSTGREVLWAPIVNTTAARVHDQRAVTNTTGQRHYGAAANLADGDWPIVVHCVPTDWPTIVPPPQNRRIIGHTVWETECFPEFWRPCIDVVDELWVPTVWNAATLRAFGWQRPVHVVPHPISTAQPEPPPIDIPSDVTVFATVSTWDQRKQPDRTIEAYLRAFSSADRVLLVVKSPAAVGAWPVRSETERHAWWQLMQIIRRIGSSARVLLATDMWTDAQVLGLLQRADAYVSLSAGEGWGLGAFDAATLGTPIIATGWGATSEWAGADYPGLVPHRMVPADHLDERLFPRNTLWAEADLDTAITLMRDLAAGDAKLAAAARELQRHLILTYHPDVIATRIDSALGRASYQS